MLSTGSKIEVEVTAVGIDDGTVRIFVKDDHNVSYELIPRLNPHVSEKAPQPSPQPFVTIDPPLTPEPPRLALARKPAPFLPPPEDPALPVGRPHADTGVEKIAGFLYREDNTDHLEYYMYNMTLRKRIEVANKLQELVGQDLSKVPEIQMFITPEPGSDNTWGDKGAQGGGMIRGDTAAIAVKQSKAHVSVSEQLKSLKPPKQGGDGLTAAGALKFLPKDPVT